MASDTSHVICESRTYFDNFKNSETILALKKVEKESLGIGCLFILHSFKSVSFTKGPVPTSLDQRDFINVTDAICAIAAQAVADLGQTPPRKLSQPKKDPHDEKK